jgi:hypothetical protein
MAKIKPGRPPGGEFAGKSAVINFRIRPDTKRLLIAAARKSGRTLSQEIELQLRRALVDMGGPTYPVLNAVSAAIDTLVRLHTPAAERWHEDPIYFDHVVRAFTGALEMFRPEGPVPQGVHEVEIEMDRRQGRAALLELLTAVADANSSVPLAKQTVQQRKLSLIKQDLGPLTARPILRELVPLAQKAAQNPTDAEEKDARELWRFIGTLIERRERETTVQKKGKKS